MICKSGLEWSRLTYLRLFGAAQGERAEGAVPPWHSLQRGAARHPRRAHARRPHLAPWVLAAYSCLSGKPNGLNAATWELVTGQSTQNDRQHRQILRLVHFPGTVRTGGLWTGDAVLLKLDAPLVLDRAAQQVCVPHEMPETNHTCVVAGWTRNEAGRSQFLHHHPVPTLALDACNSTHYLGRLNNAHTCVGFSDAQYTPCHGKRVLGRRSYSMIRKERCLAVRISLVTKQGKKRYKDHVTRLHSAQDSGDGGYTIPCKQQVKIGLCRERGT
ncbi:acrosin-like [Penaeus monodon]|uniref:acrosin-like n=1 Tax=Penaeus monodon TaxID=6687 RepID=UPI0018A75AEA|nr:acrosin-like [Penaeus monodon]